MLSRLDRWRVMCGLAASLVGVGLIKGETGGDEAPAMRIELAQVLRGRDWVKQRHPGSFHTSKWAPTDAAYALATHALAYNDVRKQIFLGNPFSYLEVWPVGQGSAQGSPMVLKGGDYPITALWVSRDGRVAVTGSGGVSFVAGGCDESLIVWDVMRGQLLTRLVGNRSRVTAIDVAPQSDLVAAASRHQPVRIWHLRGGKPQRELQGSGGEILLKFVQGGRALVGVGKAIIHVWKVDDGSVTKQVSLPEGREFRVGAVQPQGGTLAVIADKDGWLGLLDTEQQALLRCWRGHDDWVRALAIAPDGTTAVSIDFRGVVKAWDLRRGKLVAEENLLSKTGHAAQAAVFGDGGKSLFLAISDGTICKYEFKRRRETEPDLQTRLREGEAVLQDGVSPRISRRVDAKHPGYH